MKHKNLYFFSFGTNKPSDEMTDGEHDGEHNTEEKKLGPQDPETVEKELEEVGFVAPPDGGYGWAIVASSFLINMVVDGVIFTVGKILQPAWVHGFNISEASAAMTMSILSGFYFFVGPVASALCNVFGCRQVALAGSVIAAVGFLLSIPAPNIYMLYLTFGLIAGAGFGMMYLPAIVIISQYFAKKRSLATGIAVCGSGIGTTVFAMLNDVVWEFVKKDWQQFLVYTATVTISGFAAALLLRPLKASQDQIEKVAEIVENYEQHKDKVPESPSLSKHNTPFLSSLELHTAGKHGNGVHRNGSVKSIIEAVAKDVEELNRPLARMDVFYTGSTTNIAARSRTGTMNREEAAEHLKNLRENLKEGTPQQYLSKLELNVADDGTIQHVQEKSVMRDIGQALKNLLDRQLLGSPSFLLLAFSGTLTLCCFYVPFIYLGNHLDKIEGLTVAEKSFTVSLIGVLNIIARIGCGYIADRPEVSALVVNNIALILAGLATMTVPFYTAYWHFLAFCFPFSVGVACFAALRSVIVLELIGLEKMSNAFGILLTFMGVGAVIGSPMAAAMKDYTGNFDTSFYVMGALMAISGAMCIPLGALRKWELNRVTTSDAKAEVELQKLTEEEAKAI
ncbi:Protein CBG07361 [Caenorhabditis briggsae]|uniref:Protein CBG07361 n=1 Tax=Caenorhabditis briggsae TaxID=6238 RepID=A8X4X9_CAEBR|nr:Protein CBG07361 [Caenorhabditis briggsae]CAP27689.2 Protein CBG07361 [Caenorhabditis briggsae]